MITVKLSGGAWNGIPVMVAKDKEDEVKGLINVFISQEGNDIRLALRVGDDIYDLEAKEDRNIQDTLEELLNKVDLTLKENLTDKEAIDLVVNGNPDGNDFQGISHLTLKENCCEGCTCGGDCSDKK